MKNLRLSIGSREILAIALPAIVSNITTPLLGLIDTAIVGHLGSAILIGAIAVGASMFNMLYWVFGFIRVGNSGLTAQAFGRADMADASAQLWRGVLLGAALGVLLLCLSAPLSRFMIWVISPEEVTATAAVRYFRMVMFGAPAVLCTYGLSGWLLGMQDSRTIMWMALVTNIVNITVSFTLVLGFGLGLMGVAIGTVSAQWCGFAYGAIAGVHKHRPCRIPLDVVIEGRRIAQFFRINADVFVRTLCLVAVTIWFTRAGARQSPDILAANAILMQLFLFYSYFTDGFAYAGEALAGKYTGRRDAAMLGRAVRRLAWWSTVLALVFALLYFATGDLILCLLTDQESVRAVAHEYLPWIVSVPLVGTTAFMYDGVFVGLTRTRALLGSMVVAAALFFALYFILYPSLKNHGLWIAFTAYLAARGIVLYAIWRRLKRQ